jgi:hypothetical protein
MADIFEIPLLPSPRRFTITLTGTTYTLCFQFRAQGGPHDGGDWVLDIGDALNAPLVCGIPLVTGTNLLAQYEYLNFVGQLWVESDGDTMAPPTFTNLGIGSHLYWVLP